MRTRGLTPPAEGQLGDEITGPGRQGLHPPLLRSRAVVKPREGDGELTAAAVAGDLREQE